MAINALPAVPPSEARPGTGLVEYAAVVLARDVLAFGGVYKSGTAGVIAHKHADGIGYEVEVETPRFAVLTLMARDLIAV